jgi:signal transduction histidine kinase
MHGRDLRTQVLVIGLVAVGSVVAGVSLASWAMFFSTHDLGVLAVVLVVSASIAAGAALRLGDAVASSAEEVASLARGLAGEISVEPSNGSGRLATGELERLAAELRIVSGELSASRRRERALESSRRELVAAVSHDLRSPIASVRAMAEALEDGVVDEPGAVEAYHRAIRRESEHLGALVDDLFELSRITAGAIDAGQPSAHLQDLLRDVVAELQPVAQRRQVAIVDLAEVGGGVQVPASDYRRVMRNLLDNALRHTPSGGTVTLDASRHGTSVRVSVTDLPRVFDAAFRGDASRRRDEGGGGLGLAIARGLVEAHRGTIAVSNRDAGCCFAVEIPSVELPKVPS